MQAIESIKSPSHKESFRSVDKKNSKPRTCGSTRIIPALSSVGDKTEKLLREIETSYRFCLGSARACFSLEPKLLRQHYPLPEVKGKKKNVSQGDDQSYI